MYHLGDLIEFIHEPKRMIPNVGKEFSVIRVVDAWWPWDKMLNTDVSEMSSGSHHVRLDHADGRYIPTTSVKDSCAWTSSNTANGPTTWSTDRTNAPRTSAPPSLAQRATRAQSHLPKARNSVAV